MIRRRVAALASAGFAVILPLTLAAPAQAEAIRGGITGPDEGATLVTSSPRLTASFAHSDGGLDSVVLEVVSERGGTSETTTQNGDGRSSLAVEWSPQLAYNGRYELRATATGSHPAPPIGSAPAPPPPAQAVRSFFLAAPPAVPGDVTAAASGSRGVTVRWTTNPEPDLVGYQIERAPARSTSFRAVGISTASRFTDDTIDEAGRYIYRVIAVRQGAQDEGVASEPSAASQAVAFAPPATTTTAPPSGGAGGDGGGSTATTAPTSGSSAQPPVRRSGTVDLSGFRTLLEQNTTAPPVPRGETDPGFQQTLPFDPAAAEEEEVGDEPRMEVGLGEPLDPASEEASDRRQSLSFVAGGLLAFVLMMGTLFVRGEVSRSEALGMDPMPVEQP